MAWFKSFLFDVSKWREGLTFLRTPFGRSKLRSTLLNYAWPLQLRIAAWYRRIIIPRCHVIVVVGSLGKTTTTSAVSVALGIPPRIRGNSKSAVARALFHIRPWQRRAVIEVGVSKPGEMALYAYALRPNITVVTSIASEHNRSFGTLKATRSEKAKMVSILSPSGLAILNGDDQNVRWMKRMTRARIITFGFDKKNMIRATDVSLDWPQGTRLRLHTKNEARDMRIRLFGHHMVYAVLAATAVGVADGRALDHMVPALEKLQPSPGRLELITLPSGAYILRDDFKSTLETINAALDVLEQIPARRRLVALGDVSEPPGSQGPIYRSIGARLAEIASWVIFICDQRGKQSYAAGAAREGMPRDAMLHAGKSVLKAAELLHSELKAGDVVLIKGRDNQRLDRITLALSGHNVRCDMSFCNLSSTRRCANCNLLGYG